MFNLLNLYQPISPVSDERNLCDPRCENSASVLQILFMLQWLLNLLLNIGLVLLVLHVLWWLHLHLLLRLVLDAVEFLLFVQFLLVVGLEVFWNQLFNSLPYLTWISETRVRSEIICEHLCTLTESWNQLTAIERKIALPVRMLYPQLDLVSRFSARIKALTFAFSSLFLSCSPSFVGAYCKVIGL